MVMDSQSKLGQYGEIDIDFRKKNPPKNRIIQIFRVTAPLVRKEDGGSVATVLLSENKRGEGRHVFHPEVFLFS